MADKNYTFDPNSLTYRKDEKTRGRRILIRILTQFFAAIFIGVLVFFAISYTITTPSLKRIREENSFMQQEYKRVEDKYNQANELLKKIKERDDELYRAVYETEVPKETADSSQRLEELKAGLPEGDPVALMTAMAEVMDSVVQKVDNETFQVEDLKLMMLNSKNALPYIPCIMPIPDEAVDLVYYGFGPKLDPIYKTLHIHNGIDISAKVTTTVIATADGIVETVGENREYGRYIIINHKNGYKTLYAHLSEYTVKKAQQIKRSAAIGFVGNSGKSVSPHLHYGVSYNGQWINPIHYFFADINGVNEFKLLKKKVRSSGLSLD